MILSLGVYDVPYTESNETTGDVAEMLEARYNVMGTFYEMKGAEITQAIESSIAGAITNLMAGAPMHGIAAFAEAESEIGSLFRKFLDDKEIEGHTSPGTSPTKAALDGVNHRLKIKKGPRRPSFIDTGLYQQSFVAEIKE